MEQTFYKLDVQGIVYLVDPATSFAYTYDLIQPTHIGSVIWENPKEKPCIVLRDTWEEVLAAKKDAMTTKCDST
jgi:hypothetical protein